MLKFLFLMIFYIVTKIRVTSVTVSETLVNKGKKALHLENSKVVHECYF